MSGRLVDAADSVLVVIDVQEKFLDRVEPDARDGVPERIAFVAQSARFAGVPIVATVETPEQWGHLHPALAGPRQWSGSRAGRRVACRSPLRA